MGFVDKKGLLLMSFLRKNARENLTRLSRKTNIPVSTIYDKLKSFDGDLILKHTALLNFAKLGFNARANILIKVQRQARNDVKRFLAAHHNVNSIYKISNGFDFMIEGVFKHVKDVEDFLETISNNFVVEKQDVYYVIEDVKKECFLNDRDLVELVM